ncbi:choice-of-anchor Q domain-containing protein [Chloroflexus sp.]|uniref:choice-of-anchor Q domain-containing protein n=1 Tax=Chloroflexus sp. TaxID=1904827 RepID=UPI002ACDE800|nr:choice-of-anchor Q domain-containing protein [Chloroflexus sp.]
MTPAQLSLGSLSGSPAYFPLLPGSVAIDAGASSGCPTTDQRGAARPQDGDNNSSAICDVGAYERSLQPVSYTVNTLNDDTAGDSFCSLREAILAANDAPANADCGIGGAGDDTILFSVSGTITLGSTLPSIVSGQGKLTINGSGNNITISGNGVVRVMQVNGGADLTLRSLTIANGRVTGSGGGIWNNGGAVTVLNSTFVRNSATQFGGGIENAGSGTLTVRDSFFDENSAQLGGAIDNDPGTLTVTNSTFRGNSASISGGAIYTRNGAATVANSTFSGNSATLDGGGIFNSVNGTLTVVNATFWRNRASNNGGGIRVNSGSVTVKNTIVANSISGGDCSGAFAAGSLTNLATDNTCGASFTQVAVAQLNFGPLTGLPGYFPLNPGSVAIDAGDNATCAAAPVNNQSQNGVTRPQEGNGDSLLVCDIGAVEAAFADLSAAKTDNTGGAATLGQPFTWTITIANSGVTAATFASGQAILRDDLPLGATYGSPVVQNLVNVTNGSNIACAIAGTTLTCTAAGGEVTLGAPSSSFAVVVSATPVTTGMLSNPASGGACRVNPDNVVAEINATNNPCANSVTVNAKVYVPLVVR